MTDSTQRATNEPTGQPSGSPSESPFGRQTAASSGEELEQARLAFEMGKAWVQEHQTAAMLGAFAVGTFIGALMRD